jgi:uncharacterized protein (DUF488 family)
MIYTTGYEGLNIETFTKELQAHKVKQLFDVRQIPLSRKKGFSKKSLSATLAEHGITYKHYPLLGSPAEARKQVRKDHNYTKLFTACRLAYKSPLAKEAFQDLTEHAQKKNTAIMCFCGDWKHCHRKVLTEMLEKQRLTVTHF